MQESTFLWPASPTFASVKTQSLSAQSMPQLVLEPNTSDTSPPVLFLDVVIPYCRDFLLLLVTSETYNFGLHPNRNVIVLYLQNRNVGLAFDLHHNVSGARLFGTDVTRVFYFIAMHAMRISELLNPLKPTYHLL
jgi:hypothetical protein